MNFIFSDIKNGFNPKTITNIVFSSFLKERLYENNYEIPGNAPCGSISSQDFFEIFVVIDNQTYC